MQRSRPPEALSASADGALVRVLGLDIGEKRIGVAISDPTGTVSTPLAVLDAAAVLGDGRDLRALVDDYDVALIVVGLPLSMDGSEGPQAIRVRRLASRLATFVPQPMDFADERLSSTSARNTMSAAGVSDRDKRGKIDMVAASIFLQSYLDARREGPTDAAE